jgi:hypothetical protein
MAINHGSLSANLTPRGVVGGRVQNSVLAYENDYENLINKPSINDTELNGDLSLEDLGIVNNVQPNWEQDDTEAEDYIKNKPDIPENLSDLNDDADHRTVSDTEKTTWDNKSNFSGSYNDLTDKPVIPDAQIQSDWGQNDNTKADFIKNKPVIPSAQVQSDWNESDSSKADYIKNKPTIPAEQVNSDWNAESGKAQILNKPSIPTALADLTDDSTHRTVTDTEKTAWNSGEANVQSNWNETDTTSDAYIQNKPSIPSVTANPGSTTATLSSIGIDGTNYAISGGSGGGAVDSVNGQTGVVVLDAEDVGALPDDTPLFSGDYDDLTNKPTIPDDLADLNDDSTHRLVTDTEKTTWNNKSDFSGSYDDLSDKPTIPSALSDLTDDTTHRLVTDSEKTSWNSKSDFSGSYNDLSNKPTLGTASALDVPTSGNASSSQVVKGDDTRLSDARTPVSHTHTTSDITDFPTMSDYIQKSNTSGLVKNDGSIDTNTYATTSQIPDITGKADKVSSPTSGNLASLDASGNLADSGWASDKTTTSRTGNPISISGLKANQLAINPVITLEPIQAGSGDPSPSNVRAISGYDKIEVLSSGQNLLSYPYQDAIKESGGITVTPTNDGILTFFGSNTLGDWNWYYMVYSKKVSDVFPKAGAYTITTELPLDIVLSLRFVVRINGSEVIVMHDTNIANITITNEMLSQSLDILFLISTEFTTQTSIICKPMIRDASITDNTYVPYIKSTNIKLALGQTIYGGTLDVKKGILTVDRGIFGADNYTSFESSTSQGGLHWVNFDYTSSIAYDKTKNILCSSYPVAEIGAWFSTVPCIDSDKDGISFFRIYTDVASLESWKTANADLQVVYYLATPYTIQLTPHEISLLKDYAYVSTNGTNMSFSYKNGEMASLGDVENLGKTMNLLGDYVDNGCRYKEVVVGTNETWNSALNRLNYDYFKYGNFTKLLLSRVYSDGAQDLLPCMAIYNGGCIFTLNTINLVSGVSHTYSDRIIINSNNSQFISGIDGTATLKTYDVCDFAKLRVYY